MCGSVKCVAFERTCTFDVLTVLQRLELQGALFFGSVFSEGSSADL